MRIKISVWIFSLFYIIFLADVCLAVENKSKKFAVIEPPRVMLAGFAGESVKAKGFIIPEKNIPLL